MLFMLLLLRQPRAPRLRYIANDPPLDPRLLFLDLARVVSGHAAQRFFNIAVEDRSPRPLTVKLKRPHVYERIRSLILDPDRAHLVAYNVTMYERDLACGSASRSTAPIQNLPLPGTKSGGREVFASARVSYPIGGQDLRSGDLLNALGEIREKKPGLTRAIVKLNDAVSGEGNAVVVELAELPAPGSAEAAALLEQRVRSMTSRTVEHDVGVVLRSPLRQTRRRRRGMYSRHRLLQSERSDAHHPSQVRWRFFHARPNTGWADGAVLSWKPLSG